MAFLHMGLSPALTGQSREGTGRSQAHAQKGTVTSITKFKAPAPPVVAAGSADEGGSGKKPFHSNALPSLRCAGRGSRRVLLFHTETEQLTPAGDGEPGATTAQRSVPAGTVDALHLHAEL